MKVLITGGSGQLGHDVYAALEKTGQFSCMIPGREILDITDEKQVSEYVRAYKPEAIIHCAAYTAVDRAEDEKKECYAINVTGTENLVRAVAQEACIFVYISTDYVFSGEGTRFYTETDFTSPVNYYGYTKQQAEMIVATYLQTYFILRVSWLFGVHGNNFVKTMIRLGRQRTQISVVSDQIGSPTYTEDVANLILTMLRSPEYGLYHVRNENFCSWADFAREIFRQSGIACDVVDIPSEAYPTRAKRPGNSRLDTSKLEKNGFSKLPIWQNALYRMLQKWGGTDETD